MKTKKAFVPFVVLASMLVVLAVIWVFKFRIGNEEGTSSPRDYVDIEKEGTLRVVTDYSSVGYFVSDDTIAGFNHDVLQLLQSQTRIKIEVVLESNFEKALNGLSQGKYDILAYNIPVTSEMRNSLNFTEPIIQNRQVLIQRKKEYNKDIEPLRSHLDLAKRTLHIPQQSPVILRISNLSTEIGDTIYYVEDELYNGEQLIMQVAAGDIDYAVCDERTAQKIASSLPEIDYSTLIGFTHLEAWAVDKESKILLDSLNMWISKIKTTKGYKQIQLKYKK